MTRVEGALRERRIIEHDGWVIVQIRQSDGTWWNFSVERKRG